MSPSVHAEKRSCNFRAISPTVSQSTPSIGGFTPDDDASDQDSPVDPREVRWRAWTRFALDANDHRECSGASKSFLFVPSMLIFRILGQSPNHQA